MPPDLPGFGFTEVPAGPARKSDHPSPVYRRRRTTTTSCLTVNQDAPTSRTQHLTIARGIHHHTGYRVPDEDRQYRLG